MAIQVAVVVIIGWILWNRLIFTNDETPYLMEFLILREIYQSAFYKLLIR